MTAPTGSAAPARHPEAGFSLVETLVALAILAASAVAFLGVAGAHVARVGELERRAAATWAGENRLAEMALGLTPDAGPVAMLGHRFRIDAEVADTTDPELRRLRLTVRDAATAAAVAQVTGFLLAPEGGWPR